MFLKANWARCKTQRQARDVAGKPSMFHSLTQACIIFANGVDKRLAAIAA